MSFDPLRIDFPGLQPSGGGSGEKRGRNRRRESGTSGRLAKILGWTFGLALLTLLYLSSANAKTEEIRATYSALNPILRVAKPGRCTLLPGSGLSNPPACGHGRPPPRGAFSELILGPVFLKHFA